MNTQTYRAPPSISRLQQRAMIVGVIALVLTLGGALMNPAQFFRSYLVGYLFALGFALGSLGLLMLQHLSGGHWGIVIRRPLESATRTLPLLAILFLPLTLGLRKIYIWTGPMERPLSRFQMSYLTIPGFLTRAAIYLAIWLVLMMYMNSWSSQQDDSADPGLRRKLQLLSGPGMILYVFTMTLAAVDWVMSISPHWYSTIYGFLFVGGQVVSAMALMIAVAALLARSAPMSGILQPRHLHDLGKLLLAFVMLWAYFAFSQLLIIWAGNLPEEIPFYLKRLRGGWGALAVLILLFHFVLPFFLLLSRDLKRSASILPRLAIAIVLMRLLDLFWMTAPEFSPQTFRIHALDVLTPVAIGGLWLAYFAWQLQRRPLLPLGDPELAQAIAHEEHR
ncbi:MAG TPA: hypothetical protein VOA41_00380 [Candidatus Dormibacteraeota bacterium]|nr:hypothetical protein [Candidatus Dormibacteraeota bacterium]